MPALSIPCDAAPSPVIRSGMRMAYVLSLFLVLSACATPAAPPSPMGLEWLRGCWIAEERNATLRWLPPRDGGAGLVGEWWDRDTGPDRWLLEPRPQGLTLVRPITAPGGPVESFLLVGGGPEAAEFSGAAGVRLLFEGGDDRLTIRLEGQGRAATLFAGARDGCD